MDPYLQRALDEIDEAVGPLDLATIVRPVNGRWSIAEILEHLTLAFRETAERLEKAMTSGEPRGRKATVAQALARILVIDIGYFPRVEAPDASRPTGSVPPAQSLAAIRQALIAMDTALARARERFGDTALVSNHPYFQGLTVPQWRKFHWRHTVHHMRQVRDRA